MLEIERSPIGRRLLWVVPLTVLVLGLQAHLIRYLYDTFDFDTYYLLMHAAKPFAEFRKAVPFWLPISTHAWVSYRMTGYSVAGFLLPSFAASVLTMALVFWGAKRFWNSPLLCALILSVLCFNDHFLWLTAYNMTFVMTVLAGTVLYFLFLRLSEGNIRKRDWQKLCLLFIPLAFFSLFNLVVFVGAGVVSILMFQWLKFPDRRTVKDMWRAAVGMLPLAIFPILYGVVYYIWPLVYIKPEQRPDMAPFYFASSGYPQSVWGAVRFAFSQSVALCKAFLPGYVNGVVSPELLDVFVRRIIPVAVMGVAAGMLVFRSTLKRLNAGIQFTILLLVVAYVGLVLGGLLGVYPFGNIRYVSFLLTPVSVLTGFVLWSCGRWVIGNLRGSLMLMAVVLVGFGTVSNIRKYANGRALEAKTETALREIRSIGADLVLYTAYQRGLLGVRLRKQYEIGEEMGWGKFWQNGNDGGVPDKIQCLATGDHGGKRAKRVLVIATSLSEVKNEYPSWWNFISAHYEQTADIPAPRFWAGVYVLKQ